MTPPGQNWLLTGAIELKPDLRSTSIANIRALPLRPIWPGLLFNTLFYATLWSMPFIPRIARHFRRNHRRKHHRCPTCNYDLRNLPTKTCPECGTPS